MPFSEDSALIKDLMANFSQRLSLLEVQALNPETTGIGNWYFSYFIEYRDSERIRCPDYEPVGRTRAPHCGGFIGKPLGIPLSR